MAATSYFNPEQHLVFHTDKNGQMMSGGYKINNALFEQNIPLFSKWSGDGGSGSEDGINKYKSDNNDNGGVSANIIPAKFSDLFRDLAVPAGLFVMPPLFSARKYMLEQTDDEITKHKKSHEHSGNDDDRNSDSDYDDDSNANSEDEVENTSRPHKFAPVDIFDKLIALVTPTERIKLDKKTRKHRPLHVSRQNKGNSIKTKRSRPSRRNKNKQTMNK